MSKLNNLLFLSFLISYFSANATDLNLIMLVGCEDNKSGYGALNIDLIGGLENKYNIDNLAIIASQSALTYILHSISSGSLKTEGLNLQRWSIFEVPSSDQNYYLFLPKNKEYLFKDVFKIEDFKECNFLDIKELNKKCKAPSKIKQLMNNLFRKSKGESLDSININLIGHGSSLDKQLRFLEKPILTSGDIQLLYNYLQTLPFFIRSKAIAYVQGQSIPIFELYEDYLKGLNTSHSDLHRRLHEFFTMLANLKTFKASLDFFKEFSLIANINLNEFKEFLRFLSYNVNINNLVIATCYVGGKNSDIAFLEFDTLNNLALETQSYNFDIISVLSEEVVSDTEFSQLIFKILTNTAIQPREKLIDKIKSQIKSFVENSYDIELSVPYRKIFSAMIRPKNQDKWFSLFRYFNTKKYHAIDINKSLVNKYKSENKVLKMDDQALRADFLVTTPCVTVPLELHPSYNFIFKLEHTLFDKITINRMNFSLDDLTSIKYFLQSLWITFTRKFKDVDLFNKQVLIKELILNDLQISKSLKLENVYLDKDFTIVEFRGNFYRYSYEKNELIEIIDPQEYYDVKKFTNMCQNYDLDLTNLIQFLQKISQSPLEKTV